MGFFSKVTDDAVDGAADTIKDVAENKIDDVAEATGMEDNAMVKGVADKATEVSDDGVDIVADKIKDVTSDDDCCKDESCVSGTCESK